jgi:hypothetical protein
MITDLQSLKAAVASRIDRTDQETAIADAIDAATMRLSRALRGYDQEARAEPAATITDEWVTLPYDFNGVRSLRVGGKLAEYLTPEAMQRAIDRTTTFSRPFFTIEDDQLRLRPAPSADAPATIELLYMQRLVELSQDTDTNWLLTDHPDIYLAAAMTEVLLHLKDPQASAVWEQRLTGYINDLAVSSRRRKFSGGNLVIRQA